MSCHRSNGLRRARRAGVSITFALCAVVAAAVLFAPSRAPAQSSGDPTWVNPDVIALRDEVAALRREVERLLAGAAVNGELPGARAGAPTGDFLVRLDQLDTETRRLVGEMERITFEVTKAMRARDAQIAELYARIQALEGAAGVTPPPTSAPLPGDGPAVSAPPSGSGPGVLGEVAGAPGGAVAVVDEPAFEGGGSTATPAPAAPPPAVSSASYEQALEFLRARDFEKAEAALIGFVAANPGDPRTGEAVYWLGQTYYFRGQYDKAARAFLESFRDHPQSAKAPDSLLRLGVTLAQLRQKDEACSAFEQVSVRYPDAPQTLLRRANFEAKRAGCN